MSMFQIFQLNLSFNGIDREFIVEPLPWEFEEFVVCTGEDISKLEAQNWKVVTDDQLKDETMKTVLVDDYARSESFCANRQFTSSFHLCVL
jgi:hypothetical protein